MSADSTETPGPYYANTDRVLKKPIHTNHNDGSTSITVGFPICIMHDAVGTEGGAIVAELMNRGDHFDDMLKALHAALWLLKDIQSTPGVVQKQIEAVIAKTIPPTTNPPSKE